MTEGYRSLQTIIEARLRRDIIDGVFPPGASLIERELTERYEVSRGPIREVLRALEVQGLVVRHRTKGMRVASLSLEEMSEIYEIRIALETLAVTRAASLVDSGGVARVLAAHDELEKTGNAVSVDTDLWLRLNNEFHCAVYAEANAPILLDLIRQLMVRVEGYTRLYLEDPAHIGQSVAEHEQMLAAFLSGDVTECVRLTRAHMELAGEIMSAQLKRLAPGSTLAEPK